jgi:glycosyltransferase involved in cell wall biosynthesis
LSKSVMFHANYREAGGEERSFDAECQAFEEAGFETYRFVVNNANHPTGALGALMAIFNPKVFFEALRLFRRVRPQVAYVNNTWPGLSPSVLLAARFSRVPTVQALRNYRMVLPSAKLMDDGTCLYCRSTRGPWSCIRKGCAPGGVALSLIAYGASLTARLVTLGWKRHLFVTPSRVSKNLLRNRGLNHRPIAVRPNFINADRAPALTAGPDAVFVGRLSSEKGVLELVSAWPADPAFTKLRIVGDGDLMSKIASAAGRNPRVTVCGSLSPDQVIEVMRSSIACIVPSIWAEPFGRVAIEAMSMGTPAVVSANGALIDIVGSQGIVLREISSSEIKRAMVLLAEPRAENRRLEAYNRFVQAYSSQAAQVNLRALLRIVGTSHK